MIDQFDPTVHFSLKDKVVIVTGAAGQLGSAIVTALEQAGSFVGALDQDEEKLQAAASASRWTTSRVSLFEADVRDRAAIAQRLADAVDIFGRIDHVVNNAGVSVFEPFMDRPEASIDWVMDVNLKGTIFCILEYLNLLQQLGTTGGSIVNIASLYGVSSPDPRIYTDCERKNSEIYGATKAGVIQLTKYFAVHAAELDVRVNAVSPGGIRNPKNPQGPDFQDEYGFRCPMGRMAETWEIVGPVLFLMSPAAAYINGHNLVADGGTTSW